MRIHHVIQLLAVAFLALPLVSCGPTEEEKAVAELEEKGIYEDEYDAALRQAVKAGKLSMVKKLVQAGADIDACDEYRKSLLHEAIISEHPRVARYLIKAGANPSTRNIWGGSPITDTFWHNCTQLTRPLIEAGADLTVKSPHGDNLLFLAVKHNEAALVREFLEKGIFDLNARDNYHQRPYSYAVNRGLTEIAEILRNAGADTGGK